jgi:ABC-type polysaccharide/polyol phosphate export permease
MNATSDERQPNRFWLASDASELIRSALNDFGNGLRARQLWGKFAWYDMISRYRRSWVGPFWLILIAAVYIGAITLVYGTLLGIDIGGYVPYVAIGVVVWSFVSAIGSEAVAGFVEAESYIRNVRISLFVYVFRVVARNALVFVHQFVVVLLILVVFKKLDLLMLPVAAFGMLLLLMQAVWVTAMLALLGTRFRDLQPLVTITLQVLFLVTPVIWSAARLGSRRWIADLNPLSSILAVVRDPLLGSVPAVGDYAMVLAVLAAGTVSALLVYGRFSQRVIYWL